MHAAKELLKQSLYERILAGNDLQALRKCLAEFRDAGMDRGNMLTCLEEMRKDGDSSAEDTLLELMDFVTGYCSPSQKLF